MMAWVAAVVWVMWQAICGVVMRSVRNENGLRRIVAGLHLESVPVDGAAVEARRRAGLEPAHAKPEPVQPGRQTEGRRLVRCGRPGSWSRRYGSAR